MIQERIPPQDIEVERSAIGSALNSEDAAESLVRFDGNMFYHPAHVLMWEAAKSVISNGAPLDMVTLTSELKRHGNLPRVGGVSYIASISDCVTRKNITSYLKVIQHKYHLRSILDVLNEVSENCYRDNGKRHDELIAEIETVVFRSFDGVSSQDFEDIGDIAVRVREKINKLSKGLVKPGLMSGFLDYDRLACGLGDTDLEIIAGRPSMGKTAWMFNRATNNALDGNPVGVISMEMSKEQLAFRLAGSLSGVNLSRIFTGKLLDSDWPRLDIGIGKMKNMPIHICDKPALSIDEIRSKGRELKRKKKVKSIYIDYLQLGRSVTGSREQEISDISRGLKAMAKELHVPVVALSQLNRSCENRPDKRPLLSDLRESGAIEQDADKIVFVYRDEYYFKETKERGIAELIVGKNRNGNTGTVKVQFSAETTTFKDLIRMHEPAPGRY